MLVLGLGNILLSDEGVGVRTVEALCEQYDIADEAELLDGGTCGMDLLDAISGREALIVVDALKSLKRQPGEVVRLTGDDIDQFFRTRLSPHQLGLSEMLAALELEGRQLREVVIVGIVPACLDLGLELSDAGAHGRARALEVICAELERLGVSCRPKAHATGHVTEKREASACA